MLFNGGCQIAIDALRFLRPARHRADKNRRREPFAKDSDAQFNLNLN